MPFNSVPFLFLFLPGILVLSLAFGRYGRSVVGIFLTNGFLFLASIVFCLWAGPLAVWALLASVVGNYIVGLLLGATSGSLWRRLWLTGGILANLALLLACKYCPPLPALAGGLPGATWLAQLLSGSSTLTHVAVPIGVSFYTLKGISYLVDVFRGTVPATHDPIRFGCYQTLFPQLLAGPICRYQQIAAQLARRSPSLTDWSEGASRLIMGLAEKLLLADTLGRVADAAFRIPPQELSWLVAWSGAICYVLQLYYDWCGYTDMAIGVGRILGFSFPENFDYPYRSASLREFWSRWHMTLTSWLRDYIYRPLAGERPSRLRAGGTILVAFFFFGLWHGATWNFIVWGGFNACFLMLEGALPALFASRKAWGFRYGSTLLLVLIGWVIFRAPSLAHAADYLKAMAGSFSLGVQSNWVWWHLFAADTALALGAGVLLAFPVYPNLRRRAMAVAPICTTTVEKIGLLCLLVLSLLTLFGSDSTTFLAVAF